MYTGPYALSTYAAGEEGVYTYVFSPPVVYDRPTYLPDSSPQQVALQRHYAPRARGVNVFVLSDGTVVQDTATSENSNTNIPLPWILNDPGGPYSSVTNIDLSVTNTSLPVWIDFVYEGGHNHPINTFEATFLTAAGYADCIVPA